MKKTLLLSGVMLLLTASLAAAAGLNLAWNDCGLNGLVDAPANTVLWNCNSNNNGTQTTPRTNFLFATFNPAVTVPDMVAQEMLLDLQADGGVLPPWWDFNTEAAGCRSGFLQFVFRSSNSCTDWPGAAPVSGNMTYLTGFGGPDRARIKLIAAFTDGNPYQVDAGTEYNSLLLTIQNNLTVGTGNCAGCNTGVCIVLNEIKVNRPLVDVVINNTQDANHVTWRGGGVGTNCPMGTPAKKSTWGQVKSLYR